ncbi:hypothetical protein SEVIR_5G030350v4 [Setaria viridis]
MGSIEGCPPDLTAQHNRQDKQYPDLLLHYLPSGKIFLIVFACSYYCSGGGRSTCGCWWRPERVYLCSELIGRGNPLRQLVTWIRDLYHEHPHHFRFRYHVRFATDLNCISKSKRAIKSGSLSVTLGAFLSVVKQIAHNFTVACHPSHPTSYLTFLLSCSAS